MKIFFCYIICLQGVCPNHAMGSCFAGMVARHLIKKVWHSHPLRYAESWMVLLSSTDLLYKQTQLGLLSAHVCDEMTKQCCIFGDDDEVILMVTSEFCNRMTHVLSSSSSECIFNYDDDVKDPSCNAST